MVSTDKQSPGAENRDESEAQFCEARFANESTGFNLIPFAIMAGGWIAPLLMFWLYVWGPLRPFPYPPGDLTPDFLKAAAVFIACLAAWWLPASYYKVHSFERSGRIYELLGVKLFRCFVPDGDLANRWRRSREPTHRIIRNRRFAEAFVPRTILGEKSHMVWLLVGLVSAAYAWRIGWQGWAIYLTAGNLLVNLYPILLQRYTRSRLLPVFEARRKRGVQ